LQWLQNQSHATGNNMNDARYYSSKTFRNKKDKINGLKTKSYSKNIRNFYRGVSEFRLGYQATTILLNDESNDLLVNSHNISNRWKTTSVNY